MYKTIKILLIVLLLNSSLLFSQNRIGIHFSICKQDSTFVDVSPFKLIINDSITKNFENDDSLQDLPDGKYQIEYKTYFGWKKTNAFLLFESAFYYFNFCVDVLENQPIDIYHVGIDMIKNGEKMEIKHEFSGCFNSGGDSISIIRKNKKFILQYGKYTKTLREKELQFIRDYEIEMVNLSLIDPNRFCTAFSKNTISYGKHKYTFAESCPTWNGFDNLKKQLNLK